MTSIKTVVLLLALLLCVSSSSGQSFQSRVEIITVHSQNERFYLKSVPYDNESPSLRGKTRVYEHDNPSPLYTFERGFDSVITKSNNLILSNDGTVIFFALPWYAYEEREGLKSVTIYRQGRILRSYTETEINGCDEERERCSLLYSNFDEVVDLAKSNWGTRNYKKTFKDDVNEKEKFLSDFPLFSFDDEVYLTDSKKQVHIFDLKEGALVRTAAFDDIYEQIKEKGRFTKTALEYLDAPPFYDFPKLKNGKDAQTSLADYIGMKGVDISLKKDEQYKHYRFTMSSNILQDGSLEIEEIDADEGLPKEKILEFFKINKFDTGSIPEVFEKWNIGQKYFYFRKSDDRLARREKREEREKQRLEFQKRLTAESIEGVYIPKDLGESFTELDKILSEIDKQEIRALPSRKDTIQYHMGLGMWIRNNWRLWAGSRLQKYFTDRGITHPDNMSSILLTYYHDWLNGKKETWRDWERDPKNN